MSSVSVVRRLRKSGRAEGERRVRSRLREVPRMRRACAWPKHTLLALLRRSLGRVSGTLQGLLDRHRRTRAPVRVGLDLLEQRAEPSAPRRGGSGGCRAVRIGARYCHFSSSARANWPSLCCAVRARPTMFRRDSPAVSSIFYCCKLRTPAARPPPPVKQKSYAGGSFAERRAK